MFDNTIAEDKSYAEGTMNKHVIQEVMQGCKEKNLKILKKIEIVVEQLF